MSIHERIKAIRIASGLSQEGFATSIEMKRSNYAQIELGKQYPTLEVIKTIVRIYNKSYEWLIDDDYTGDENGKVNSKVNGKATENLPYNGDQTDQYLPRIITVNESNEDVIAIVSTKAAAGYLNGYADEEYIQDLPTIAAPGFRGALHRCFEVKGNSMPPNHDGSLAVGRFVEKIEDIRNRRVYIVVSKNDGIVLKRVINDANERILVLISDNPNKRDYPNYTISHNEIVELWEWRGALIRSIPDPSDFYNRMNDMEATITIMSEAVRRLEGKDDLKVKVIRSNS